MYNNICQFNFQHVSAFFLSGIFIINTICIENINICKEIENLRFVGVNIPNTIHITSKRCPLIILRILNASNGIMSTCFQYVTSFFELFCVEKVYASVRIKIYLMLRSLRTCIHSFERCSIFLFHHINGSLFSFS